VPPPNSARGACSIASANRSAEAVSSIAVQSAAMTCSAGPVHCNIATAMEPVEVDRIACATAGSRNAAA